MQMVSIIKGLMQGIAVLLIILGLTFVIDYQLNRDDPYFEDPDTVELTYGTATYFFVMGGILLLFGIFYREDVNLVVNLVATVFLALAVYTGHSLAVSGMKKGLLSYGSYERPELVVYLGVSLFLVSLVALVLVWIHFSTKLFRESAS
ncbi:hypothetical protein E3E26_09745 [Thermococcus sp. LS1]|uniref:hypothetical protein n=1 Tax=Thermococcus sp. LS1 TaxID=1638259 RepID=UPI00143C3338|nr:hypothetical protein [Thermococcus sp. LS1]NJE00054.1 hypothetical protein [Thermococcus sp. LS1]